MPLRTHRLKVCRGRFKLTVEALTVDVQASTFDRRSSIVDLRARTWRHLPPTALCVLLNLRVPFPNPVSFIAISLAYVTMFVRLCLPADRLPHDSTYESTHVVERWGGHVIFLSYGPAKNRRSRDHLSTRQHEYGIFLFSLEAIFKKCHGISKTLSCIPNRDLRSA